MKKSILIIILLLALGVVLNAMWYRTCDMYYPTVCDPNTSSVPALMTDSAGALLEAHLHFTAALNEIQKGDLYGISMNKLRYRINTTNDKFQLYEQYLSALCTQMQSLQTDPVYTDQLMRFDYQTFGTQKGYISTVYDNVRAVLSQGDLTAIFVQTNQSSAAILEGLQIMQTDLIQDIVPTLETMHELNQKLMETILYIQYVVDVCEEIKNGGEALDGSSQSSATILE